MEGRRPLKIRSAGAIQLIIRRCVLGGGISERDGKTGRSASPAEQNQHPRNAGSAKEIRRRRGSLFRKCRQGKRLGILALPLLPD